MQCRFVQDCPIATQVSIITSVLIASPRSQNAAPSLDATPAIYFLHLVSRSPSRLSRRRRHTNRRRKHRRRRRRHRRRLARVVGRRQEHLRSLRLYMRDGLRNRVHRRPPFLIHYARQLPARQPHLPHRQRPPGVRPLRRLGKRARQRDGGDRRGLGWVLRERRHWVVSLWDAQLAGRRWGAGRIPARDGYDIVPGRVGREYV